MTPEQVEQLDQATADITALQRDKANETEFQTLQRSVSQNTTKINDLESNVIENASQIGDLENPQYTTEEVKAYILPNGTQV